jgi:uncharacterized DUF497 family protein
MEDTEFEWDDDKAVSNLKKHKMSFDEGATIFNDPLVAHISDPDHSEDEERFVAIGISVEGNLLVVAFTERSERIRIISCRKATRAERKIYENI